MTAPDGPERDEGPAQDESGTSAPGRRGLSVWTRNTLMGLAPLAALVLFFVTKSWTWFLLVPVVGVLLYGARGDR